MNLDEVIWALQTPRANNDNMPVYILTPGYDEIDINYFAVVDSHEKGVVTKKLRIGTV